MTINQTFAFNVCYLAKQKGLKIGDIEKQCEVSVGYFSRIKKNDSSISLDVAYKASQIFDVGIDNLCSDFVYNEISTTAETLGYKLVPIDGGD